MDFIRKKIARPHIEIAPLVDIIFLLLIFFMLSSNFIKPAIKMDLPKALFEEKLTKVDLVITVSKDNEIYINKDRIELDCLKNALIEKMASLGKYDVIFRGDKTIGYEIFISILDIAKDAGAVSFSVEHDDE